MSATVIGLPDSLQFFLYLLQQADVIPSIDEDATFSKWLGDAKKSTNANNNNNKTQTITFGAMKKQSSNINGTSPAISDRDLESTAIAQSPVIIARKKEICGYIKQTILLLEKKGFPISLESSMPANSAAIIQDQAQVIRELQSSITEQEKISQGEVQLLKATMQRLEEDKKQLLKKVMTLSGGDGSPATPNPPNASSPTKVSFEATSGSPRVGGGGGDRSTSPNSANSKAQFQLLEARQEIVKLKNLVTMTQKDLAFANREVTDLKGRMKENEEVIQSLEIAFAAMQTVHENDKELRQREEAKNEFDAIAMVTRLTRLTSVQAEQLVVAEEVRSRQHQDHVEELDCIATAHKALVARLEHEIDLLRRDNAKMADRNRELLHNQSEITGRQARVLEIIMRNNVEIVEKQYRPASLTFRVSKEEHAKKLHQETFATAMEQRHSVQAESAGNQQACNAQATQISSREIASIDISVGKKWQASELASAMRKFPLPPSCANGKKQRPQSAR